MQDFLYLSMNTMNQLVPGKGKMFLENYAKRANPLLRDFFREQRTRFSSESEMLERIEEFCLRGGKRLRPALVYLGYRLLGGKDSDDIVKTSLVVELIHSFLLIHDDVMDESFLRRGKPTLHKRYEDECKKCYQKYNNHARLGESLAVLAGDLSHCLALNLLHSAPFPSDRKMRVLDKLHQAIQATIFGQELDLRLEAKGMSKPKDILRMYRLKTAQYTFECPLQVGVILTGGSNKDLELISSFSIPLGIAFQIQDDILGLFGDKEVTGKSVDNDIRQGKQTLLIAKALENGREKERKTIQEALGNNRVSKTQIKELQDIVKSTGALSYAEQVARKHLRKAEIALEKMFQENYDRNTLRILKDLTDFVIERNT